MAKGRKIFYTMGQVCEMFDLPASTIRFWETRFSVLRPKKNAKGNRLFMVDDIENLKLIYHLTKEKKMTLSGAEKFLMQRRLAAKGEMSLVELLQKVRSTLLEIRQELETVDRKEGKEVVVVRGEQVDELEPEARLAESVGSVDSNGAHIDSVADQERQEPPKFIELTLF